MSTALGTRRKPRRGSVSVSISTQLLRRIARLLVLAAGLGAVVGAQHIGWAFTVTHFFSLFYLYVAFALWFGEAWESFAAVAGSWLVSYWLFTHTDRHLLWYNAHDDDTAAWLVFVVTSLILLLFAVHMRRISARPNQSTTAPLVATDVENPVLIVHGHAQIVQGGGVVFDTRASQQATERLAQPAPPLHTPPTNNPAKTRTLARDVDDNP